jgi:DNA primase
MPAAPSPEPAGTMRGPRPLGTDAALRARIDRIKNELPIANVIERYLKLQSHGENLVGVCPFHNDRNPSFAVFPGTGTFHCFGCLKHGDVITFFREIEGLSFYQALDRLDTFQHEPKPEEVR